MQHGGIWEALPAQHWERSRPVTGQVAADDGLAAAPTETRSATSAPEEASLPNIAAILSAPTKRGNPGTGKRKARTGRRARAESVGVGVGRMLRGGRGARRPRGEERGWPVSEGVLRQPGGSGDRGKHFGGNGRGQRDKGEPKERSRLHGDCLELGPARYMETAVVRLTDGGPGRLRPGSQRKSAVLAVPGMRGLTARGASLALPAGARETMTVDSDTGGAVRAGPARPHRGEACRQEGEDQQDRNSRPFHVWFNTGICGKVPVTVYPPGSELSHGVRSSAPKASYPAPPSARLPGSAPASH
jgi:hypothetical protein